MPSCFRPRPPEADFGKATCSGQFGGCSGEDCHPLRPSIPLRTTRVLHLTVSAFHPSITPVRHCCSNWRLPAPAYAGHPAFCCLDFPPLLRPSINSGFRRSSRTVSGRTNYTPLEVSLRIILITRAKGIPKTAPTGPPRRKPINKAKILSKGLTPVADCMTRGTRTLFSNSWTKT